MLAERFETLQKKMLYTEGIYDQKCSQLIKVTTEVEQLDEEVITLTKVQKILSHLMDKLVKKDLAKMDQLITYGLSTVFPDRSVTFSSELKDTGKRMNIELKTQDHGEDVDEESKGAVSVVESLILRMLCILKLKKARILLLDETFASVHSDYIGNVGKLLSELAKKLGIDVLLVTHNPGPSDSTTFRATYTNGELQIRKVD